MLEKLFKLKEHGTNVRTEVMAGLTTFMTMAYILAVNPNILSAAGMDSTAVLIATCLASFIGTTPMNLFPPPMLDLGRTVGVRPENIRIVPAKDGASSEGGIAATVDLVEPLGSETLLHCLTDDRKVKTTVRVVGGDENVLSIRPGDRVTLLPDMSKAITFG